MTQMTTEMQACLDECMRCAQTCEQTLAHCLEMGGRHAERNHIALLRDCIRICQTSAAFLLSHSTYHTRTCAVCAEICRACAEDCERIDVKDEQMRECAAACRRCAESCERMAH